MSPEKETNKNVILMIAKQQMKNTLSHFVKLNIVTGHIYMQIVSKVQPISAIPAVNMNLELCNNKKETRAMKCASYMVPNCKQKKRKQKKP